MPEPETPLAERPWDDVERMLGVDEALARIVRAFSPVAPVDVAIAEAAGRVLAADLVAAADVPPFRNSAMDGYAVRAVDTAGATFERPVVLTVAGIAAAGRPSVLAVVPGGAVRIMTGAPLPSGADAVVRFEETDEGHGSPQGEGDRVLIFRPARRHDNVRDAGEDVATGTVVLRAGRRLRPADIGLLAALGQPAVRVRRRPRVAILSTGDELVPNDAPLAPGAVRDANSFTLAAMARQWGAETVDLGIARDQVADLSDRLERAAGVDLLVSSGGVSVGDYDLVKDVLRQRGDVFVWQVRMKPGKPLAFGRVGGTPLLGLPGNPVAAAVSFLLFGRPAILALQDTDTTQPTIRARAGERLDNRGMRRHYVRASLVRNEAGELVARTAGEQGAGVLSSLSRADALLIVPETLESVEPGTWLDAIPLATSW